MGPQIGSAGKPLFSVSLRFPIDSRMHLGPPDPRVCDLRFRDQELRDQGFCHRPRRVVRGAIGILLALVAVSVCCPAALAQRFASRRVGNRYGGQELFSGPSAAALGMEVAWVGSLTSPYGVDSLVDVQLFVDVDNKLRYQELTAPDAEGTPRVLSRMRMGGMSPEGRLLDDTEATRLATNEIRRLKRRGMAASSQIIEAPTVTLYSLSGDGALERRDGETGDLQWRISVGNENLGYGKLGVGPDHVAVINGGNLILVAAKTGKILNQIRTRRPPSFGAVISGSFVVVHTVGGNIEIYPLDDITRDPFVEHVQGAALARPVALPVEKKLCWPTDRGYLYVTELSGSPSTLFRLGTDGLVNGGAASAGKNFFFATDRGQAYGLRASIDGEVLWVESLGEPIDRPPVVASDRVLFVSDYGLLFCLSQIDGTRQWDRPARGISAVHAAFDDRIYASDNAGMLIVLNLDDGTSVELPGAIVPNRVIQNSLTNRLYLVNARSMIQCLRPIESPLPKLAASFQVLEMPAEEKADDAAAEKAATPAEKKDPFGAADSDPFGAGDSDPFGGGEMDDPFGGGGSDPFGGGNGGSDPFGGADPFGGSDPFN